jgi:hypothetical protein
MRPRDALLYLCAYLLAGLVLAGVGALLVVAIVRILGAIL